MKSGSINLLESLIIPKEGSFKPNGNYVSVELFSADMSAASTTVELQASISGDRWDTLQESGSDISETLTSGVALVRSFEVDPDIELRFLCAETTGTVTYVIFG